MTKLLNLEKPESFRCPVCGRVSYNPDDIREGYCGACHAWTSLSRTRMNDYDEAIRELRKAAE